MNEIKAKTLKKLLTILLRDFKDLISEESQNEINGVLETIDNLEEYIKD